MNEMRRLMEALDRIQEGYDEDKEIDWSTLEVDGIDINDYPDFVDAYFDRGQYTDGTEIEPEVLERLTREHGDLVTEIATDQFH